MNILDFLPKYPNIVNFKHDILNPYQDKFNNVIPSKKEFEILKLETNQNIVKYGEQYNHQKILSRYINAKTPYNNLLIFHEMGTGKTCTAIGIIEGIRYDKDSNFKGALIIVKGLSIAKNFIQELFFSCTGGKYIPKDWDDLTDIQRINKLKKEYGKFYKFTTFETFAKEIKTSSNEELMKKYSNHIIVIDEVHNLREKDITTIMDPKPEDIKTFFNKPQINIYKEFHRFLHIIREVKILLMSGTPMKDDINEFASIMNLILPLDNQFVTGTSFNKRYFKNNLKFNPEMVKEFSSKIIGKISYLKNSNSVIKKNYKGTKFGELLHFIVYPIEMSEFQSRYYLLALTKDLTERNIYTNSRQASLFVFPNGTYGTEGFNQYIIRSEQYRNIRLTTELKNALQGTTDRQRLEKLKEYSSKFASVIKIITDTWPSKSIVYCEFVNGSGCILFSKILELFGFQKSEGRETSTVSKRYAMLINQTTTDVSFQNIIKLYNDSKNVDGEYLSVIIGSRVISEGYTFKNVDQEFILTPHWNYSETEQVIARGWRLGSHNDKIIRGDQDIHVDIYQYVSLPLRSDENTLNTSIDLTMYEVSEKKDLLIKQIEYIIKINAFDCPLFIERNKIKNYDNQRDCEYKNCDYVCDGSIKEPLDYSTYNIYYSSVQDVQTILTEYFKSKNSIDVNVLSRLLPNLASFEIIHSLQVLINENVIFEDKYGIKKFLRINDDNLFLVNDAFIPYSEPFMNYYYKNLFIENGDSFQEIINDMYNNNVPNIIDLLFKEQENFFNLVNTIPPVVQRLLLQTAIVAEEKKIKFNATTRKNILKMFKDFYGQVKINNVKFWTIWLYRQELGSILYWDEKDEREIGGLWLEVKDSKYVDDYIIEQRNRLLNTPIGYYGLYNPQLKEFCLRDVTEERTIKGKHVEKDLRRAAIGRRCYDYSKPLLVDILVNRIRQPYDATFLNDVNHKKIKEMVMEIFNKYNLLEKRTISVPTAIDDCKRYIFFSNQTRKNLCSQIQEWLQAHNLIEQSFDCGTAYKNRSNI